MNGSLHIHSNKPLQQHKHDQITDKLTIDTRMLQHVSRVVFVHDKCIIFLQMSINQTCILGSKQLCRV